MIGELQLGQLVYSTAGRDKGRAFFVVALPKDTFVYVADGDLRKIERPKKKNIKHVRATKMIAPLVAKKLENGEKISNAELRSAIAEFVGEKDDTAVQGG